MPATHFLKNALDYAGDQFPANSASDDVIRSNTPYDETPTRYTLPMVTSFGLFNHIAPHAATEQPFDEATARLFLRAPAMLFVRRMFALVHLPAATLEEISVKCPTLSQTWHMSDTQGEKNNKSTAAAINNSMKLAPLFRNLKFLTDVELTDFRLCRTLIDVIATSNSLQKLEIGCSGSLAVPLGVDELVADDFAPLSTMPSLRELVISHQLSVHDWNIPLAAFSHLPTSLRSLALHVSYLANTPGSDNAESLISNLLHLTSSLKQLTLVIESIPGARLLHAIAAAGFSQLEELLVRGKNQQPRTTRRRGAAQQQQQDDDDDQNAEQMKGSVALLCKNSPNLRRLEFHNATTGPAALQPDDTEAMRGLDFLERLCIEHDTTLTSEILSVLFRNRNSNSAPLLPFLTKLELTSCHNLGCIFLADLAAHEHIVRNLTALRMIHCNAIRDPTKREESINAVVAVISKAENLREFTIRSYSNDPGLDFALPQKAIDCLAVLPNLECVELDAIDGVATQQEQQATAQEEDESEGEDHPEAFDEKHPLVVALARSPVVFRAFKLHLCCVGLDYMFGCGKINDAIVALREKLSVKAVN